MDSIKEIINLPYLLRKNCEEKIIIQDYDHFIRLAHEFDSLLSTKTYIIHAPIYDVLYAFNLIDRNTIGLDERYSFQDSIVMDEDFKLLFKDSNKISWPRNFNKISWKSQETTKQKLMQHYIRISVLVTDIKQNKPLHYSMGLHHMKHKTILHPGGSRRKVLGIYKKPVYFVITDFTKKICQDYPRFKFYNPEDVSFPVDNCYIRIRILSSDQVGEEKYRDIILKEVDEDSYEFKNIKDPNEIMLKDDKFYYNNDCIFIKQKDNRWKINI